MGGKPGRWANINDAIQDGDSDVIVEDTGNGTVTINIDGVPIAVFDSDGLVIDGVIESDTPSEQTTLYYSDGVDYFARVQGVVGGAEITGDLDISQWAAIGSTASINNAQADTRGNVLVIKETFESTVNNGAWGINLSVRSEADAAGAYINGASITAANYAAAAQNHITGLSASAISSYNTGMTVTTVKGGNFLANLGGDNSIATLLIGLDVATSTGFGMAATSATEVMGIRVQPMSSGSGAFGLPSVYGVKILAPGFTSTGTKTNLYGIHIADQSQVGFTNDYNIYSAGSGSINLFEGKIHLYSGGAITEVWNNGGDFIIDNLYESAGMIFRGEKTGGGGSDMIVMSPDGSVDLSYNGTTVFLTTATGISITDGTAEAATIGFDSDDLIIHNNDADGTIIFRGQNNSDAQKDMLLLDPDGGATMYYAGNATVVVNNSGIQFQNGSYYSQLSSLSTGLILKCFTDNQPVKIQGEVSTNTERDLFIGRPDGAAELYYAGTKAFETASGGSYSTGWIGAGSNAVYANLYVGYPATAYFQNHTQGDVALRSDAQTGFQYSYNGKAGMYYANVEKFATTATGVDVSGDIKIDTVPGDAEASGIVITGTVDTNALGVGALLMLGSDGNWDTADADAEATCQGMLGLAVESGTGASKKILLQGFLTTSNYEASTVGEILYASTDVGAITITPPSGSGDIVRILGYGFATNTIYFDPDKTYIEVP